MFSFVAHVHVYLQSSGQKDTQGWKKTGLCTERGSVCIVNLGVWKNRQRATREERCRPVWIVFTQWTGSTLYSLHTEFGWYLRTFGMVYCGD